MKELHWAVLGTGVIANEMAQAMHNMGRTLYGVCNRTYDKAVSFAENIMLKRFLLLMKKCMKMPVWT